MRRKIIAGNWKMNYTLTEAINFVNILKDNILKVDNIDVGICPTTICLSDIKKMVKDTDIKVGAQNVYYEDKGAYTGEISAGMLKDIDIDYCIIGHSERRQYFAETDEGVNLKAKKLIEHNITPIICVGETLSEREQNSHFDLIKAQIIKALKDINEIDAKNIVIAYEPIWAIGTGVTATSSQAEEMCKYIRDVISEIYNENVAENIRIQYGGSVNISNIDELMSMPNIDGTLIGGASLKPEFIDIIKSVEKIK